MKPSDWPYREDNWRALFGPERPVCPHYIGAGDWRLDCELQYGLCGGRDNPECPLNEGGRDLRD